MRPSPGERLARLLASRRVGLVAMAAAVALSLPSVPTGWYLDDILHRAQFLEIGPMANGSNMTHRMFDFLSGDPEDILAYKELGVLPWWAFDELRIRFWRPLSAFTHVLDYRLWPDSAEAMHLHNIVWLALLVGSVGLLYRRLIAAPLVAGIATLLYAIDDAHGMPVAFLANRNAMVAATFGVLSVWLHDKYRRDRSSFGAVASPLAFLLALLGGESGLGAAPYLLGYALFLDSRARTLASRVASIAPHALVGIGWLAWYKAGGYGSSGSSFYLDPIGEPVVWLSHFVVRAPLLLLGQWFLPPSSFSFAWTAAQLSGVALFGVFVLLGLFFCSRPILRQDATARFFAFGMLLAVVPITAGYPHDRLLFFVGVGAMGLLAMLLVRLFDPSIRSSLSRALGWALIVVHVVIAAPFHLVMVSAFSAQGPIYEGPPRSLPDDPELERQRLIIVNHPNFFYGQYTLIVRAFDGTPVPQSQLLLAPGTSRLVIERSAPNRIAVASEEGWLGGVFDNVYRAKSRVFPDDYEVRLSDLSIRVTQWTDDGRPKRIDVTCDRELEHGSFRWVRYENARLVPFDLPAVGETRTLEAVDFSLFAPPEPAPSSP